MGRRKTVSPISGTEFAARRSAIGLTNGDIVEQMGVSISAVTKWISGELAVSQKAVDFINKVEDAVDQKVGEILAGLEATPGITVLWLWHPDWKHGSGTWHVVVSRARHEFLKRRNCALQLWPHPDQPKEPARGIRKGAGGKPKSAASRRLKDRPVKAPDPRGTS